MRTAAIRLSIFAFASAATLAQADPPPPAGNVDTQATVRAVPPTPANASTGKAGKKDAAPESKPERTPEEVRKILGEPVKCSFLDMELRAALADLSQQSGLRIKYDGAFLAQQPGESEQITVSLETQGMPLRRALRKLVEAYPMAIGTVGDTVWISSEEGLAARQLRQYVTFECREKPLAEAVAGLAEKYSLNLVVDAKAKKSKAADTPVTLKLEDATLETVLRVASEMAGLKPVRIGSVIFITAEDRADKLRDGDSLVPALPLTPDRGGEPMPIPPMQPGANPATPAVVPPPAT